MGERFSFIIDVMIIVLVVLSRVYFIIYFINVVLRKGKPMPHDKLSGTVYMSLHGNGNRAGRIHG